jgi:hypothetical protein
MPYNIDIRGVQPAPLHALGPDFFGASPDGVTLAFNNYYIE